jgi:hypothetical protein
VRFSDDDPTQLQIKRARLSFRPSLFENFISIVWMLLLQGADTNQPSVTFQEHEHLRPADPGIDDQFTKGAKIVPGAFARRF